VKDLLEQVQKISPHAEPILVLALTTILGLLIGSIRVKGLKLGVAGMLFSGLIMGHFGVTLDPHLLAFLKEFGLVLFVFTVGLQLGPGFFHSLKKDGLKFNALAAMVIVVGAMIAYGGGMVLGWKPEVLAGLFSGATTNTPSLGAAQQLLAPAQVITSSAAYAIVYPCAVVGLILALVLLRVIFRINVREECVLLDRNIHETLPKIHRRTILVEQENVNGLRIRDLPELGSSGVIISRIFHQDRNEISVARADSTIHVGDKLLAVGAAHAMNRAVLRMGREIDEDLRKIVGPISAKRLLVTSKRAIGKNISALVLQERCGVTVSRVSRQDLVFAAGAEVKLQFGDMVNVVGDEASLMQAEDFLGNSVKQINETSFAAIFLGIALGVLFGLYPWHLPGIPVPLRLGLAGGPLLVAIVMGRLGRIGPLVIHMPINANNAFRELGIIFFLGCVGLGAGGNFVATAISAQGLTWMVMGLAITLIPILSCGIFARKVMKLNYLTICGLLAGSMTDPPALAFANKLGQSDHPSLAYANVYPLTMLLRIVVAQVALLWLL